MAIHNSPGRGLKLCINCKKYIGVRSRVCPSCACDFVSGSGRSISDAKVVMEKKEDNSDVDVSEEIAFEEPVRPERVRPEVSEEKIVAKPGKGSRLDRIDFLKKELIRELKNSSRSFGAEVVREITEAVLPSNF